MFTDEPKALFRRGGIQPVPGPQRFRVKCVGNLPTVMVTVGSLSGTNQRPPTPTRTTQRDSQALYTIAVRCAGYRRRNLSMVTRRRAKGTWELAK